MISAQKLVLRAAVSARKQRRAGLLRDFSIKEFYFLSLTHILISGLLAVSAWPKNAHSR
jgi:hypothetical protein